MHELSLVYQVVRSVDNVLLEQKLNEVDSITLQIGEMSDVVPKFIEEAWAVAKDSTSYPNAKMIVEVIPAVAKCVDCGHTEKIKKLGFTCPKCESENLKIISGREFLIKEIVAK